MNSFKNTKAWSWLDKNILRNWGVPLLLHWLHILNNEKQNRYFKPSRSKFCLEAYGNMTVLLPKSVKPNQGVLYKITFFSNNICYFLKNDWVSSFQCVVRMVCLFQDLIRHLIPKEKVLFLFPIAFTKKIKIFRNMKLFEVLPAYSIVFLELGRRL